MIETRHRMYYQRRQWAKACRRAELADELPPRRPWTQDDDATLRRHYDRNGPVWCGVRLNRSVDATKWHAMKLRAVDELAAFARRWVS